MTAADTFAPACPSVRELDTHRTTVTRALSACGVASRKMPDVTQDVLVAAWIAGSGRVRAVSAVERIEPDECRVELAEEGADLAL